MLKQKCTPLQELENSLFTQKKVRIFVKREELNHNKIQGNKLYKLELNLKHFFISNKKFLLTFGGAFSNHIAATAAACQQLEIPCIGVIRGLELYMHPEKWSLTLQQAHANGMQLIFINRKDYRLKNDSEFLTRLALNYQNQLPEFFEQDSAYVLPEGGSNLLAVQGMQTLAEELDEQCPQWDQLYCAVGTGATLSGLTAFSKYREERQLFGVAVIKQGEYLQSQIENWIFLNNQYIKSNIWQLITDYHFGGYAKTNAELKQFLSEIWPQFKIPLDPIYTAKTFACFWHKLQQDQIPENSTVILLHSGGLQGGKVGIE